MLIVTYVNYFDDLIREQMSTTELEAGLKPRGQETTGTLW